MNLNDKNVRDLKLYTEDGEFVGTLGEIIAIYNGVIFKEFNKHMFEVKEDQRCPMKELKLKVTCDTCERRKYCKSWEKNEP